MTLWRSFGASVIGPDHLRKGIPNQDAWISFHLEWGDGIVVSDGVGSKSMSNFGSKAACMAVLQILHHHPSRRTAPRAELADKIKSHWTTLLSPLDASDCSATCLFAFRTKDGSLIIGMLGDGLAAIEKADGSVVTLSDDKSDGFSNITAALSPRIEAKEWRWLELREEDSQSVFLCSDGVADDLTDIAGFVKEFWATHRKLSSLSASRRTREMLEKWPTPKHSDDKTIACLFREEAHDE